MSFCVNFTLFHHDGLTILPNIQQAGVCQEYDRDEPAYPVVLCAAAQRRYLLHVQWGRPNMGLYVPLVALQVESGTRSETRNGAAGESVKCFKQVRSDSEVCCWKFRQARPAVSQHLPDTFAQSLPPLSRFGHPLPKVLGVEHRAVEKETRHNFGTA